MASHNTASYKTGMLILFAQHAGARTIRDLVYYTERQPMTLWEVCRELDLTYPEHEPYPHSRPLDALIRKGRILREMTEATGIPEQTIYKYLHCSGQVQLWKEAKAYRKAGL